MKTQSLGIVGSNTRAEYAVVGDRVNMAARLMCKAQPGQIFCDFNTRDKCDKRFLFDALEPMKLKGKPKPVQVYEGIFFNYYLNNHYIQGDILNQYLNSMLEDMIRTIQRAGIDIIKFAGDALQCVTKDEGNMGDAIIRNVLTALKLLKMASSNKHLKFKFGVHCGVGCGAIASVRVGGIKDHRQVPRWEHFVVGPAVMQAADALDESKVGEVVLSSEALKFLLNTKEIQAIQNYEVARGAAAGGRALGQGRALQNAFEYESLETGSGRIRINGLRLPRFPLKRPFPSLSEMTKQIDSQHKLLFADALKSYCPSPLQLSISAGTKNAVGTCRLLATIFIMLPDIGTWHVDDSIGDYLHKAQKSFGAIMMTASYFDGTMRQFIVDDKGAVAIIVFGLPPFSVADSAGRAIETALTIKATLTTAKIGVTMGSVYSGKMQLVMKKYICIYVRLNAVVD
jgi:class 3 adenylate cyclase